MFSDKALDGLTFAIWGIANDRSLAYVAAQAMRAAGGNLVMISHPMNEKRAVPISTELEAPLILCDVTKADQMDACMERLGKLAPFAGILHSIAYSDKNELKGEFIELSLENFLSTMHISCYSLVEIARSMRHMLCEGASILTYTFDASQGPYPHYNGMGGAKACLETFVKYLAFDLGTDNIRVNAISASPEETVAARNIGNFRRIGDFAESMSPMGRRATVEEIGKWTTFLFSPDSSGMTGQIVFVDCGSSVPKMPPVRNARKMADAVKKIADTAEGKSHDGE